MVNPVTLDKNDMIFALPALSIYIRIFYNNSKQYVQLMYTVSSRKERQPQET